MKRTATQSMRPANPAILARAKEDYIRVVEPALRIKLSILNMCSAYPKGVMEYSEEVSKRLKECDKIIEYITEKFYRDYPWAKPL